MKPILANDPVRILVAEDSPTQAEALRHLLASKGYEVMVAGNGLAALAEAQRHKPALVISDILMPEMDGFHLCRSLRNDQRLKDVPVILLTSLTSPDDVIQGLENGADNFIRKPYDSTYLISRIEHILLNTQVRHDNRLGVEIGLVLRGNKYRITAERQQILDLLISTYEDAVHLNAELTEKQGELSRLTDELEQRVKERTVALHAEIEERRRMEQSLRQLASIVESSEDAIVSADLDGIIRSWNSAADRLFGYSREEALGLLVGTLVPDDYRPPFMELAALARQGAAQKFEGVVVARDGRRIGVSVTLSPVRDSAGRVTGISGILRDLTERKGLEEQVRQSQKLEAIGRLAGGVAHDFNNLLSVIGGYSELALERPELDDTLRRNLGQVREATQRAVAVTRQLLAFSRRQVLEPRVLDLNAVVTGLEKMLRRLIGEDIDFQTHLTPDPWHAKADATQIEQVIMNLVVNARDAMPTGGTLSVSTGNIELDAAHARSHPRLPPGAYVLLAVCDSGVGIPAEILPRIFEPFFTTKDKDRGTGLGLSTVYGIVEQSGGSIEVSSEVGKGTTFEIFLPRVAQDLESGPPSVPAKDLRGTETVLVVEDSDGLRQLAHEFLAGSGYTVLTAASGPEALLKASQHPNDIHVLITDVILPKMSGVEVAKQLRKARTSLRVIYASGYTAEAITVHGLAAERSTLLEKPYSKERLLRVVREALDAAVPENGSTGVG